MMKGMVLLIAVSAAISSAAGAQDTRSDIVACRDTATTGLYRRCALWLDGNSVRRGEEGLVVARPGFFTPIRLSRVVAGDSALWYAHRFEHRSRQAAFFGVIGALALAGTLSSSNCVSGGAFGCGAWDTHRGTALGLLVGGTVFSIAGVHFQVQARRAGAKAVWWNNERFAR